MSHFGRSGPPDIRDTYSLLVLNVTFRTTQDDLLSLFDRYGKVMDIFIPKDKRTGVSRGFAFVRYKYVHEAQKAIDRLDGKVVDGREIMVQFAKYGPNAEPIQRGRITEENPRWNRSRSRSPRQGSSRRYRDDYNSREHHYRRRSLSRDSYDKGRYRGREREYRRRSRSRSPSPSESISRSHSRGSVDGVRRISAKPSAREVSPGRSRSVSPRSRPPARRSPSPASRSISPVRRRSASPGTRSASPNDRVQRRSRSVSPVRRRRSLNEKSDAEE